MLEGDFISKAMQLDSSVQLQININGSSTSKKSEMPHANE
jgi:hypothetical protein